MVETFLFASGKRSHGVEQSIKRQMRSYCRRHEGQTYNASHIAEPEVLPVSAAVGHGYTVMVRRRPALAHLPKRNPRVVA